MSNEIDKNLFEEKFGHTLIKLADKLINATNKKENQIINKNIKKNNWLIKIIWRSNKIVKKERRYYPHKDYDDKELKCKYFKIKLADMSNEIDEKLFEKIFGHTLIKLVDKLINTTNKEENQIIVKNINANKLKLDEQKKPSPYDWVIQPSYWRANLIEAINLVLDFNKSELKDLV